MSKTFILVENGIVRDRLVFDDDDAMKEYFANSTSYEIIEDDPENKGFAYMNATWDGQVFTRTLEPAVEEPAVEPTEEQPVRGQ